MSSLCSLNLSVGVYTTKRGNFFRVTDKTIGGQYGPILSKFLISKEENNCRFVPVFELGKRLNGNFTG